MDPRNAALDLLGEQLGEHHAATLLERASLVEYSQGEVLLQDQGEVDALYLLVEGRLSLSVETAGHTIRLGEIDAGNWVGEVALFSGSARSVSRVEAVTAARLLRLAFQDFRDLIQKAPETACKLTHVLIGMLIQRLRATANDPILDPDGQLLLLGQLSAAAEAHAEHHGIRDFLKNLLGVR
jgi:CRP-like cAMP-binding protein